MKGNLLLWAQLLFFCLGAWYFYKSSRRKGAGEGLKCEDNIIQMDKLMEMWETGLTEPLAEQTRPKKLDYLWALESMIGYFQSVGFHTLAQRFLERYVEAAASACYGVRNELKRPELVNGILSDVRRFVNREKLDLTRQERLSLLEAAHPNAMGRFWKTAEKVRKLWK